MVIRDLKALLAHSAKVFEPEIRFLDFANKTRLQARKCLNVHSVHTNLCLNIHGVCTNLCLNVHSPCLLCSPFEYGKGMYKFVFYA